MQKSTLPSTFAGQFTSARRGVGGLSVTVDVYDPASTKIITAGTAIPVGGGIYRYQLAVASYTTPGVYFAVFKATDPTGVTLDWLEDRSEQEIGVAGVDNVATGATIGIE